MESPDARLVDARLSDSSDALGARLFAKTQASFATPIETKRKEVPPSTGGTSSSTGQQRKPKMAVGEGNDSDNH
jgi:hypothetical protein